MKFGDTFSASWIDPHNKSVHTAPRTYKYTVWYEYHTDNVGDGLWKGDKQIEGCCQFSVRGCKTEKSAKDKIRRYVQQNQWHFAD